MVQLESYNNEIFDFLRTVTIKNTYFADQIKYKVMLNYQLDSLDDVDNPYYLHMLGEYQPDDTPMYVHSFDTGEEVLFEKDLYINHPKTASLYRIPSKYFNKLRDRYKDQTDLIKSTIYPVPLISAEEMSDKEFDTYLGYIDSYIKRAYSENGSKVFASIPNELYTYFSKEATRIALNYCDTNFSGTAPLVVNNTYVISGNNTQLYIDEITALAVKLAIKKLTINKLVSKPNYSLINYDDTILQENERDSIIQCINKFLNMISIRWDVKEFVYEDCYPHVMWSALWYVLPLKLHVQRVNNIKTASVHVFHIWEYLTSKGLNDYRTLLSIKQQLFMYKNIIYLLKNRGKTNNLNILAEVLLKDYNVSLKSKSMLLNNGTKLLDVNGSEIECATTPEIISEEIDSTTTVLQDADNGIESVAGVFKREVIEALEPVDSNNEIAYQSRTLSTNDDTYLTTKLIELRKQPVNSSLTSLFYRFLTESMLYRIITNELGFTISIQLVATDLPLVFSVKETVALIMYAIGREYGRTLKYIPDTFKVSTPYTKEKITYPNTINVRGRYDFHMDVPTDGSTYLTSSLMSVDKWISEIPVLDSMLNSPSDMVKFFDEQFNTMSCHVARIRSIHSALFNTAVRTIYPRFLVRSHFNEPLVQLKSETYSDIRVLENTDQNNDLMTILNYVITNGVNFCLPNCTTPWAVAAAEERLGITVTQPSDLLAELNALLDLNSLLIYRDEIGNTSNTSSAGFEVQSNTSNMTYDDVQITNQNNMENCIVVRTHKLPSDSTWGEWIVTTSVQFPYTFKIPAFYSVWFKDYEELNNIIEHYNIDSDVNGVYGQLAFELIAKLFPLEYSSFAESSGLSEYQYQKMKALFTQMCSYNITFIDTDRTDNVYLFMELITVTNTKTYDSVDRVFNPVSDPRFKHKSSRRLNIKLRDTITEAPRTFSSGRTGTFDPMIPYRVESISKHSTYIYRNLIPKADGSSVTRNAVVSFASITPKED